LCEHRKRARQDSLDLHIALGVEPETFEAMLEKAKTEGLEVRGPVDRLLKN